MKIKSIASAAIALFLSTSANAALINNGTVMFDTNTGLEWLDLTETAGRSYDDIASQLGVGGEFEGWAYATMPQVERLFDSAGGTGPYVGWSSANNGVAANLLSFWGDTSGGFLNLSFITAEPNNHFLMHNHGRIFDDGTFEPRVLTEDFLVIDNGDLFDSLVSVNVSSALVRVGVVPVPPAFLLFGSGFIWLTGLAMRKKID